MKLITPKKIISIVLMILSRPCVWIEVFRLHNMRVFWHTLTHGNWENLRSELEGYIQQPYSSCEIKPVGHDLHERNNLGTVLVIDRSLPQFDRDAGSRATWQYIELLLSMRFRVIVWGHDFLRREPYATRLEEMGVEVLSGSRYACGRWKKWLRNNAGTVDYIIVHRPNIAIHYVDFVRRTTRAKILYFGEDLRWLRNMRRYELENDRFFFREAMYWKKIEARLICDVDAAYYYSEAEALEVKKMIPQANIRVTPLFMVKPDVSHIVSGFEGRTGLLFVGGFGHAPNVDGILWFAREILPILRRRSSIILTVVGVTPPRQLLDESDIITVGSVSDEELHQFYERAKIVIAPLRYGAGIKGKVVEAICHQIPTVTTTIGAEGLAAAGSVLDVCDDPLQFAAAIERLYFDKTLWLDRSDRMELYLTQHFSRESAISQLRLDLRL